MLLIELALALVASTWRRLLCLLVSYLLPPALLPWRQVALLLVPLLLVPEGTQALKSIYCSTT